MNSFLKYSGNWQKQIIYIFLFISLSPSFTFGAENYKVGDKLYVGPTNGIIIRKLPDIKALILAKLDFNSVVIIQPDSLLATPFQLSLTNFGTGKLMLHGNWVKVRSGKITGYVFDGMLTRFKGMVLKSHKDDLYLLATFGKPKLQTVKKSTTIKGEKLDYETEINTYPKGLVINSTFFDGCYTMDYTFKISFNEAYWLIERMLLDADAAQEIQVKKEKANTVLSFYSCS